MSEPTATMETETAEKEATAADPTQAQAEEADTTEANKILNDKDKQNSTHEFDQSNRRVMLYNIYKYAKIKQLEKAVNSWIKDTNIEIEQFKKPSNVNWLKITLKTEEMADDFLKIVNDGQFKNKKGGVIKAEKSSDGRKRRDAAENADEGSRKKRRVDCVQTSDQVRDSITPLWKLSYEAQLEEKSKGISRKSLSKIVAEVKKKFRTLQKEAKRSSNGKNYDELYEWLKQERPIEMRPIIAAPKKFFYRNKCELTFGYHHQYEKSDPKDKQEAEGCLEEQKDVPADKSTEQESKPAIIKTPACGFMAGGWDGGVSNPHNCYNVPDEVCGVADIVNGFLRTSPLPPYYSLEHRGVWRYLTIRTSDRTNECMVIICHAPPGGAAGKRNDGSDDYSSQFESEKKRLVKMLTEGNIPKPTRDIPSDVNKDADTNSTDKQDDADKFCKTPVTSIFFQEYDGLSNPKPEHPVQHAYGKEYLEEKLLNCTFQISPGAFFQVTTDGAEVLYKEVVDRLKEVTTDTNNTLLFDVCCGTGTIGLTCLKEGAAGRVVGIDISEPAIKDAWINAKKNGYSEDDDIVSFVASRAESVMQSEIQKAGNCPMVAIVDPARDGLHHDVIRALRNAHNIERIIYVSCNPTGSLIQDGALLCSPPTKRYPGLPFKPTSAQPCDMFPLTPHCELVIVFDRMSKEECLGTVNRG